MRRSIVLTALLLVSCKKEQPSGLPAAQDWKGSAAAAPVEPTRPMPPDHPPVATQPGHGSGAPPAMPAATAQPPRTLERLPDGRLALGPLAVSIPKDWTEQPVTSNMRAAGFVLSSKPGEEAELVIYYFGESGAGSVQDNLDRWLGQFQQADGKPSKDVAKIENTTFAGKPATIVSVSGRFVAMAMPGATDAVDKPDQSLLAAIVDSPKGPYYFKLVGANKTVAAHAAKFRAMLGSLKIR